MISPPPLFCSTRGADRNTPFEKVLLSAYASDGGLFVPESLPLYSPHQLRKWALESYTLAEVCAHTVQMFTGIPLSDCLVMTRAAFKTFNEGAEPSLPLLKVGNRILLDTGRVVKMTNPHTTGPTLAFKDIGQQVCAQLLNYYLGRKNRRATIIVETSGDTGPAAVAAVKSCPYVSIFCLYPHGRVSPVQELQLTTVDSPNVHVFRTEGNTDEQAEALKKIFMDKQFAKEYNVCSINSINFARIMAQSSYYVWVCTKMLPEATGRLVDFVVPSGAMGNAVGGFLAKCMGAPVGTIHCATNANDIVFRTLKYGDMSYGTNVPTVSPAMDIQFAYNLERVLYFASNENHRLVNHIMKTFEKNRGVKIGDMLLGKLQNVFTAMSVTDEETLATIQKVYRQNNYVLCPHSAIGVFAFDCIQRKNNSSPMVAVLTANPAKFEHTIEKAGVPQVSSPTVDALKKLPCDRFSWLRAPISGEKRDVWAAKIKEKVRQERVVRQDGKLNARL
eukprot:g3959.t1